MIHLITEMSITNVNGFAVHLIVATILGALIGLERQWTRHPAGILTNLIVCLGAFSFTAFSFLVPGQIKDITRVAAQVVSGISFLGAGVIFKHGSSIKGLTTAAGIWATAGIGLAIGAGMYGVGLFSMIVIALIQLLMHKFKFGKESWADTRLVFKAANDKQFRDEFMKTLESWNAQVEDISVKEDEDNFQYDVLVRIPEGFKLEDAISYFQEEDRISNYSIKTLQ